MFFNCTKERKLKANSTGDLLLHSPTAKSNFALCSLSIDVYAGAHYMIPGVHGGVCVCVCTDTKCYKKTVDCYNIHTEWIVKAH
jgi:hypothetical protein